MRFKDEKQMWYADTELLAGRLANKSEQKIQEILDKHDVIQLRSGERPNITVLGRLAFIILVLPLMILSGIKWMATGDQYLDSWCKKSKILKTIVDYIHED